MEKNQEKFCSICLENSLHFISVGFHSQLNCARTLKITYTGVPLHNYTWNTTLNRRAWSCFIKSRIYMNLCVSFCVSVCWYLNRSARHSFSLYLTVWLLSLALYSLRTSSSFFYTSLPHFFFGRYSFLHFFGRRSRRHHGYILILVLCASIVFGVSRVSIYINPIEGNLTVRNNNENKFRCVHGNKSP